MPTIKILIRIRSLKYLKFHHMYTEKNRLRNFTQLLSKVGIYAQVGDFLYYCNNVRHIF